MYISFFETCEYVFQKKNYYYDFNKFIKDLFNCNNIRVELINKLILRRKEINTDQNNLCK